jgi:hypothetical protein
MSHSFNDKEEDQHKRRRAFNRVMTGKMRREAGRAMNQWAQRLGYRGEASLGFEPKEKDQGKEKNPAQAWGNASGATIKSAQKELTQLTRADLFNSPLIWSIFLARKWRPSV